VALLDGDSVMFLVGYMDIFNVKVGLEVSKVVGKTDFVGK